MINCEKLISEVYKREPLWNNYNVLHRSAVATNTLWNEVADVLEVDCYQVKKKWKGLRDYYRTELKKMYGHKPGDATINLSIQGHQVSTWPYYEMLHFLKESMLSYYVKPKNSQSLDNEEFGQMEIADGSPGSPSGPPGFEPESDPVVKLLTPREQQIKTEPTSPKFDAETEPIEEPSLTNAVYANGVNQVSSYPKRPSKRPRLDDCFNAQLIEIERQKLALLEKEAQEADDDDFMFLKSLLPDIRNLPRSRKLLVRMKMQEIVYNEISKLENERNETRNNT